MKIEELQQLSIKQILSIIGFWNNADNNRTNKVFVNFTEFVGAIEKGVPYHENSPMVLHLDNGCTTITFPHAFYDMTEGEEAAVFNVLKDKFDTSKKKEPPTW